MKCEKIWLYRIFALLALLAAYAIVWPIDHVFYDGGFARSTNLKSSTILEGSFMSWIWRQRYAGIVWNAFWKFSNWTLVLFWQEDIADVEKSTLCGCNIAVSVAEKYRVDPYRQNIKFNRENQDQCDRRAVFSQSLWRRLRSISDFPFAC